ncbi:MAG: FecR domain-containing protein [Myxococcota bacterium]
MSHQPKYAALWAYHADLLSEEGTARLERHLKDCEICQRALASIRTYEQLAREARRISIPPPDYGRMELRLRRTAKEVSEKIRAEKPPRMWPLLAGGVAAVAAVGLAFAGATGFEPEFGVTEAPEPTAAASAVAAELTAASGHVVRHTAYGAIPADVGSSVVEGDELRLIGDASAHLRLDEGTGVRLEGNSRVQLARLRDGEVSLRLRRGAIDNDVASLGLSERYEIHAGEFTVRVVGTRFRVRYVDGTLGVRVDEGEVQVLHRGSLLETVAAPGVFGVPGDAPVRPVFGHRWTEASAFQTLRLANDAVESWSIEHFDFDVSQLAVRVPEGDVHVRGFAEDKLVLEQVVAVLDDTAFSGTPELTPSAPEVRYGFLPPELILHTVRRSMSRLRACRDRLERQTGVAVSGRFTLRATIGLTGAVQRAQLVPMGEPAPASFNACVLGQVRNWSFPPPTGGFVRIEQPLRFSASM